MPTAARVVLLRAIGPETHKRMTMRALEAECRAAGLPDTRSLLATGNLVVRSPLGAAKVRAIVLGLLAARGVRTAAILCDAGRIAGLVTANPDPGATRDRPAQVQVILLDSPLTDPGLAALRARATHERIERIGADLWIDYAGPISASKLTAKVIERTLGCLSTARNWNTVLKLADALSPSGQGQP